MDILRHADCPDSRPAAAILLRDNYEDLMKACEDTQRSAVLAQIDEKLQTWANAGQGILLKTDRNHYLFLFEEQYFQHFVDEKFSILDTVRAIRVAENIHPTLSIGIGKDSPSIPELYKNAKLSLEMALSRGGDQAVVRNQVDFAFYGRSGPAFPVSGRRSKYPRQRPRRPYPQRSGP